MTPSPRRGPTRPRGTRPAPSSAWRSGRAISTAMCSRPLCAAWASTRWAPWCATRSGRLAVVLDQNPAALVSPRVKVFFSTKSNMPIPITTIDLAAQGVTDKIVGREPPRTSASSIWTTSGSRPCLGAEALPGRCSGHRLLGPSAGQFQTSTQPGSADTLRMCALMSRPSSCLS